jgi:outer membrane receptor protein involved in Fe transport
VNGYSRLNGFIGYAVGPWDVRLNASNLTNEKQLISGISIFPGEAGYIVLPPLQVMLQATRKF